MSERCAGNHSRPTEQAPSSPGRGRVFPLARVCSVIRLYLARENSSAARGDDFFYIEKKKQHLKHDEMCELTVKKGIRMEMIQWMQQCVWDVKVLCPG